MAFSFARIIAVADVIDALTTQRPYKPARPLDLACRTLTQDAGPHFDPACVTSFLAAREEAVAIWADTGEESLDLAFHSRRAVS